MDISDIKHYVQSSMSVNQNYFDGDSFLHFAIKSDCSSEIIQFLLDQGADVNAKTPLRDTPLHLAMKINTETVKLLIQYGANINA